MRLRAALVASVVALLAPIAVYGHTLRAVHHRVGLILHDSVKLYSRPSTRSTSLATLMEEQQVVVLGRKGRWTHVSIWAGTKGWTRSAEIVFRKPWKTVDRYKAPVIHYHISAHGPYALTVPAMTTAPVHLVAGTRVARVIPPWTWVTVTRWRQDARGAIWYQIDGLWAPGNGVQFRFADPGRATLGGVPLWRRVSGKGMWLTLGTVGECDPRAVVQAAKRAGVTHLYLESAISPLGFHGRHVVGPLIDAAHRAHIAVIAWVYPYLSDVASDVALTNQVAAFRTPSGNGFDGVAEDIERNVLPSTVRAYSQLVRAALGPHYLIVGVTYPPQSFPGFPFAEMAHDDNVLAPMDYWHQTNTPYGLDFGHLHYGYAYGYRYARDSIAAIRAAGGHVPIAPIGQSFDNFSRLEIGPYGPSADEIHGFLAGSKANGAIGASFFQWMTATPAEWRAIRGFRY